MEVKRSVSEPEYAFEHLHAVYQIVSKFPGNDYSKREFWKKVSERSTLPKCLRESPLEEVARIWNFIQQKTNNNTQYFKTLFRDYDRTAIGGNKYHEEIRASINDIFFGGKSPDPPMPELVQDETKELRRKKKKKVGEDETKRQKEEINVVPTSYNEPVLEVKYEAPEEAKIPDMEPTVHVKQEIVEEAKIPENIPVADEALPDVEENASVHNDEPVLPKVEPFIKTEPVPIKPEPYERGLVDRILETEIRRSQKTKAVQPLDFLDRMLEFNLNKLYKINGKLTTTGELNKKDHDAFAFFDNDLLFSNNSFYMMYNYVVDGVIPQTMLDRTIYVSPEENSKEHSLEFLDEDDKLLLKLQEKTGKSIKELKRMQFSVNGELALVEKLLNGTVVPFWNEQEDQTLKLPSTSAAYLDLIKAKGEEAVLARIRYLESPLAKPLLSYLKQHF
eukprot:TRINITY_DN203_c1_g2_i1.p2 TRINITY_DN203_c1_g2~~TRINITY_DN203_c1_g2_i1.p2  ORF type:complete len:447 (+),score=81.62 TRINITY_DN203_c1_g2_i1:1110-2450(+)